jgi:hypothetical protein
LFSYFVGKVTKYNRFLQTVTRLAKKYFYSKTTKSRGNVPLSSFCCFSSFCLLFHFLFVFLQRECIKRRSMNTMIGTIPMDAVLTMLNSLSRHDRRWLVEQMAAQVEREDAEAKKNLEEFVSNASTRNKEDNELLDAFLANISGDWGGDGSPTDIACDLRQGAEAVREVETW